MANDNHPKSFRFSDEELALLEEMSAPYGGHKAALVAGLHKLKDDVPSNADLIRLLEQRLPGVVE